MSTNQEVAVPPPPPLNDNNNNDDNDDDEVESGGISSASCIITIRIRNHKFHPVYTHQLFENESIPGYEPMMMEDGNSNNSEPTTNIQRIDTEQQQQQPQPTVGIVPHKSFVHHNIATHKLAIDVELSPSCRICHVTYREKEKNWESPSKTVATRRRLQAPPQCRRMVEEQREKKNITPENGNNNSNDNDEEDDDDDVSYPSGGGSDVDDDYNEDDDDGDEEEDDDDDVEEEDDDEDDVKTKKRSSTYDSDVKKERMSQEDISKQLQKALPQIMPNQQNNSKSKKATTSIITRRSALLKSAQHLEDDYLPKPIGKLVHEYTNNDCCFVATLGDGTNRDVLKYHNLVQNLSLWFIETADAVDLSSDEGGGFWKVMYLFQKHTDLNADTPDDEDVIDTRKRKRPIPNKTPSSGNNKYSLVGYTTIFYFHSPFKKPKSGLIMRVCQVLILPHHQRCGHGKTMLQTIYKIAREDDHVVEITVEDPAPSFVALRNRVDYDLMRDCITAGIEKKKKKQEEEDDSKFPPCYDIPPNLWSTFTNHESLVPLPDSKAVQIAAITKIIPRQIQTAYELYQLNTLHTETSNWRRMKDMDANTVTDQIEALEKKYRIIVKKRLLKLHSESLGGLEEDQEEKKRRLADLFDGLLIRYRAILHHPSS